MKKYFYSGIIHICVQNWLHKQNRKKSKRTSVLLTIVSYVVFVKRRRFSYFREKILISKTKSSNFFISPVKCV